MIKEIYKRCIRNKANSKDNVWLILEYDTEKDLYRPKVILEDGRTILNDKKEHIGNWQKRGLKYLSDFYLSEGVDALKLDTDFYDADKLDRELEEVIRNFCSSNQDNPKNESSKSVEIKLLQDTEVAKKDTVLVTSQEVANHYVNQKLAVILEEPKLEEKKEVPKHQNFVEHVQQEVQQDLTKNLVNKGSQLEINDRKKEAKWVADKQTLDNHTHKIFKNKEGLYEYPTIDDCQGYLNVWLSNAKKWVDIENQKLLQERQNFQEQEILLAKIKLKDSDGVSEILVNKILKKYHFFTIRDDTKPEIWVYEDGLYVPNGKSLIQKEVRKILGEYHSPFLKNLVVEKISAETQINPQDFFQVNHDLKEIPILDGIFNLITHEISSFTPDKVFFHKIPVHYDPDSTCPNIEKHFKTVLKSEDDVKVMYEIFGFLLYRDYFIEKAIMMVGAGRNGKSKTIELMKRFIGAENCSSVSLPLLTSGSFSVHNLFSKLANLCGDLSHTSLKDTGMFKELTGRDLISADRKFKTSLSFTNFAKLIFACNELPRVYDGSDGFWNRWILFEFPYQFVDEDVYTTLPTKLKETKRIKDPDVINKISTQEELNGLFIKALEGLKRILKNKKFSYSTGTDEIKKFWMRKADSFMAFCLDNLEEDYNSQIAKKDIRKYYHHFCKQHKVKGASDRNIKTVLEEMFGVSEAQLSDEVRTKVWEGIKLKDTSSYCFMQNTL